MGCRVTKAVNLSRLARLAHRVYPQPAEGSVLQMAFAENVVRATCMAANKP